MWNWETRDFLMLSSHTPAERQNHGPAAQLRPFPALEPRFPKGANVNFYDVTGPDQVTELTYERGVEDFTYACGTGTGSVVLALTLTGQVSGKDVSVSVPGGTLRVTIDREGSSIKAIWLTGPTNVVCTGEVRDEELSL